MKSNLNRIHLIFPLPKEILINTRFRTENPIYVEFDDQMKQSISSVNGIAEDLFRFVPPFISSFLYFGCVHLQCIFLI